MFRTRYRIVKDGFLGYEVQIKKWWMPIWVQAWSNGPSNTHSSVEDAEEFANAHRNGMVRVVKMLD